MTQEHKPCLGLRLADRVILSRVLAGTWRVDGENGEIISRNTGKPLSFSRKNNGYRSIRAKYKGFMVDITKHRAVYIGGTCRTMDDLPVDLNLHIDHINGNIDDCRLANLRLIPCWDNNHPQSGRKLRIFTDEQVGEIRRRYAKGEPPRILAVDFGVARSTIHRIVSRRSYAEVGL
ncbi:hypothetical protein Mlab_1607 [Methanocorpusculum labreanum Z]|uniref:HNH endonuclease n=1 Tax=Methanocorpusculum labreanum (strain ATCC 43576 / DSM 4855 / Z) TaxID=410358 RepID=A2STW3_METLZ|nr:hypothetical protein [Methanocorpusculum labreanum]ABN07769.1 hypothetical protein Mlab_1607 [Methanocorpusculum labreanum Z]